MKLLIVIATLGLAALAVRHRRRPPLHERVRTAVKDAAGRVKDGGPGDVVNRLHEKAEEILA